jgi:glycosyltransferase involved in cell wall biosynthesis
MILLINASNLKMGGAIQVALSFIQECINFTEDEFHVLLSPKISSQLNQNGYPENFHFYLFQNLPTSLIYGIGIISQLRKLENKIRPDCVFTISGPSYWTPKAPHLLGYAQGYYLYPESPFFERINLSHKIKINLLKTLHRFLFIRNAEYYFVESEDAKKRLSSFLAKSKDNIYVVSNTYHSVFNLQLKGNHILPPKRKNEVRLLTISAYYQHKNLEIIKDVISELKKKSALKFIFILTINASIFENKFEGYGADIINMGPVHIDLCPKLYQECDFLFLPTLVEILSASYPEAMKMKKPILTSDLSFARDICGDAAEYFNPENPKEIADKIIYLANTAARQIELIENGEQRLQYFETPESRARKLMEICKGISEL